jgi:hypothetical protein
LFKCSLGYYGGGGTFRLIIDGAYVPVSSVTGGCVLNGSWILGSHDLSFGRHSATFQYSTSDYSDTLSTEGMRISFIFVNGTGYINLDCEECEEGLYFY